MRERKDSKTGCTHCAIIIGGIDVSHQGANIFVEGNAHLQVAMQESWGEVISGHADHNGGCVRQAWGASIPHYQASLEQNIN